MTTNTNSSPAAPARAWLIVPLAMSMTLCALAIGRLAYGLLLPAMRVDLGLSVQQAGNLGTASSLGYLLMVLPAGFIASRRGPRLSILIGLALIALACGVMAVAQHYAVFIVLMIILGFGTALLYTPLIALIIGWYPNRRGSVIGIANSGIGIGMLAIGLYVPVLIENLGHSGFKAAWASFAAFAALVLVLAIRYTHNPPGAGGGQTQTQATQRKADRQQVFNSAGIRMIAVIYGVLGVSYIVQSVFMYSYALDAGIDPVRAGVMASTMGLLSILAGSIWGGVSDWIGRAVTLMICFSLTLLVTLLPVILPTDSGFFIHFAVSGLVVGGLFTVILAATSERVPQRLVPVAVSLVTVVFALGQLIGPAAAAVLIEWSGQFQVAFIASSLLMLAGVYFAWRLWQIEKADRPATGPQ